MATKTRKVKTDTRVLVQTWGLDLMEDDGVERGASVDLWVDGAWTDESNFHRFEIHLTADGETSVEGADTRDEARSMIADRLWQLRATDRERRNDMASDELQAVIDLLRERGQSVAALAALKAAGF
jgi:hypothetical protein